MTKELSGLSRLGIEAMGPCHACGRQLLETEVPVFYRVQASQCAIDAIEIRKHVGLAMAMGGGAGGFALAGGYGGQELSRFWSWRKGARSTSARRVRTSPNG